MKNKKKKKSRTLSALTPCVRMGAGVMLHLKGPNVEALKGVQTMTCGCLLEVRRWTDLERPIVR